MYPEIHILCAYSIILQRRFVIHVLRLGRFFQFKLPKIEGEVCSLPEKL